MHFSAKIILLAAFLFSGCYVTPEVKTNKDRAESEQTPVTSPKKDSGAPKTDGKPNSSPNGKAEKTLQVVGVNDGDTITVFDREKRKQLKIRLATIDAPEYTQPFGKRSRKNLSDLVYKKEITVKSFGNDRYGRLIGEIFVGGKNINVEQIKSGYAWHYKQHQKQQTFEMRLIYSQAQNRAKEKRLGIWQYDNPTPPWAYRKQNPRNRKLKR